MVLQWEKVWWAEGLSFIAPVFWLHFPAILKGWFERVLAYGDAYALTDDGWRGEVRGRVPLLHHQKAVITFYQAALVDDETRRGYLQRAYRLGRAFAESPA